MDSLPITPFSQKCKAQISVPGSKSISNRAFILAAMGNASVKLKGLLVSEDVELMQKALVSLGLKIRYGESSGELLVKGCGGVFPVSKQDIFVGNAGTVARFLTALLAMQENGEYKMDGTDAMRKRPMIELINSLSLLGCKFEFLGQQGCFPFIMKTSGVSCVNWKVDATKSSQVLSALMMIAPIIQKKITIQYSGGTVSEPFIDLTMQMMKSFSDQKNLEIAGEACEVSIEGCGYNDSDFVYQVEPDATAASYFLTLPLVTNGVSNVLGVFKNMQQGDSKYCEILQKVGGQILEHPSGLQSSFENNLSGGNFDFNPISDTFLTLAAISPLFKEPLRIYGIKHTRKQETDRVRGMAEELTKLGQQVNECEDSLEISPCIESLKRAAQEKIKIDTYHDHRFAMSFAILGCHDLFEDGKPWLTINNPMCCAKTFPDFFSHLEQARIDSNQ